MNIIDLIAKLGFPIAAALVSGSFVFLTLKFILAGVTSAVTGMSHIIENLNNRIDVMDNELQKIDIKISTAFGLEPDYARISRSGIEDNRKD